MQVDSGWSFWESSLHKAPSQAVAHADSLLDSSKLDQGGEDHDRQSGSYSRKL